MTMLTPTSRRARDAASNEVSDPITQLLRATRENSSPWPSRPKSSWCSANYAVTVATSCATATCQSAYSPPPSVTWRSTSPIRARDGESVNFASSMIRVTCAVLSRSPPGPPTPT